MPCSQEHFVVLCYLHIARTEWVDCACMHAEQRNKLAYMYCAIMLWLVQRCVDIKDASVRSPDVDKTPATSVHIAHSCISTSVRIYTTFL